MIVCPVILAGGFGKRLWPLSTLENPKQFIAFFEKNVSFFQQTVKRIRKVFSVEKIVIVCNILHIEIVKKQLKQIKENNYVVIVEKESKNTFCSLLLVLKYIEQNNINITTLFISTTDSYIENTNNFVKNLKTSCIVSFFIKKHVVFGIKPTNANTNYGYIKFNNKNEFNIFKDANIANVEKFIEKPNLQNAQKFLSSSNYLWNSGNFILDYHVLLEEIKNIQSSIYNNIFLKLKLLKQKENIFFTDKYFLTLSNLQFDKAIVEKSKNLLCCKADFDWCDIGSFDTIYQLLLNNKIIIRNSNYYLLIRNKSLLNTKSTL